MKTLFECNFKKLDSFQVFRVVLYENGFMSFEHNSGPPSHILNPDGLYALIQRYTSIQRNAISSNIFWLSKVMNKLYLYTTLTSEGKYSLIPQDTDEGYTMTFNNENSTHFKWVTDEGQLKRSPLRGPSTISIATDTHKLLYFSFSTGNVSYHSDSAGPHKHKLLKQLYGDLEETDPDKYVDGMVMLSKWHSILDK